MTRTAQSRQHNQVILATLNRWLRAERAAVVAYGLLIDHLPNGRCRQLLVHCQQSHRDRLSLLTVHVRRLGGEPVARRRWLLGAVSLVLTSAIRLSEGAALRLLHALERWGHAAYLRAHDQAQGALRPLVHQRLLPEQRWTVASVAAVA